MKNLEKLLTIVVPVYKVEPYIIKCLDSCVLADEKLMSQLEVIIVNDGTPDNSAEMSREYVKRYPQTFRQIDKVNGGHGSAWNVGLKEATGKYLRFLDSDDWLANLQPFMLRLQNEEADVVMTDYVKVFALENRIENYPSTLPYDQLTEMTTTNINSMERQQNELNFWNSTYKTSILKPLYPLFAEHVLYDDSVLYVAPMVYGKTFISYSMVLYNYLIGRVGQSMSDEVQRKNVRSNLICFYHIVSLKKRVQSILNEDQDAHFDKVITDLFQWVFPLCIYLPYKEAKEEMGKIYGNYSHLSSKMWKRYERLPFGIFYALYRLRDKIHSKS